tara:strand:- start:656 stop:862 length:207 start_codon:yes stop_codon:yes gene_type:complete
MSFRKATEVFTDFLEREKQRNIQMLEVSRLLRVDLTFTNEELIKNAEEAYIQYMEKLIVEQAEAVING